MPGGRIPGDEDSRFVVVLIEKNLYQVNHRRCILGVSVEPSDLVGGGTQRAVESN